MRFLQNYPHFLEITYDWMHQAIKPFKRWLKPGGKMITVATSKQGWKKTAALMNQHWSKWRILKTEDLLLADYYQPFIVHWLEQEKRDYQNRIFKDNNSWYQRLYFLEAQKE